MEPPITPALRAAARRALDVVPTNVGFVRAVIDSPGLTGTPLGEPAELWADRADDPRAFHAVHPYGMSQVWGPAVDEAFDVVVERLRARAATGRHEWVQVEPRWHGLDWDGALGAVPIDAVPIEAAADPGATAVRHVRITFRFDEEAFRAGVAARPVPDDGWTVRDATEADFAIPGSVVPAGFWPDAATWLAHGGGAVVERDGQVGALALASYRWDGFVEIGIETSPAHRRQGLASRAAAALVERVLAAGLTPVWSCREDNTGSVRLAERLGFVPEGRWLYLHIVGAPA
jgi:GNAT superfamily N-acetyltransferase